VVGLPESAAAYFDDAYDGRVMDAVVGAPGRAVGEGGRDGLPGGRRQLPAEGHPA
jgi:hypothetical protein